MLDRAVCLAEEFARTKHQSGRLPFFFNALAGEARGDTAF